MDAAWALEASGLPSEEHLIHLEVGQPDFAPPEEVLASAREALGSGGDLFKYIPNAGLGALRAAVAADCRKQHARTDVLAEHVVVCNGAANALFTVMQATLQPGDEVLIPDPGWANYALTTRLVGGSPVLYELDPSRGWKPDPRRVEAMVTPATKVLLLCSPSNPTGAVLTSEELDQFAAIAARHGLVLISDEIYAQIYFGSFNEQQTRVQAPSILESPSADFGRVVLISGVSKAWAMTGFRVGWLVTQNAALARTCSKLLEASISCGVPLSQAAAHAALTNPTVPRSVAAMVAAYKERRDIALGVLRTYGLFEYCPEGAFYLLVRLSEGSPAEVGEALSVDFCKRLLRDHYVAVSPGSAFGAAGRCHVRVSLASKNEDLQEGMRRLCEAIRGATR